MRKGICCECVCGRVFGVRVFMGMAFVAGCVG